MPKPTPSFATAIHESGHALMAIAFRWPVERVSIRTTAKHAGICEFKMRPGAPATEIVSVYLAGLIAERFVVPDASVETADTDMRQVLPHLPALNVGLEDLVRKIRYQLASRWPEVDRLAEALDRCGELDGGEVLRAIRTPIAWIQV